MSIHVQSFDYRPLRLVVIVLCLVSLTLVGAHVTTEAASATVPTTVQGGNQTHNVTHDSTALPTVTGQITPQTPPAATTIAHEITIDSQGPLPNGTGVLLPTPYRTTDVTVSAVNTEANVSPQFAVETAATGQVILRLRTEQPVEDAQFDLRLSHPARSNVTQKQLRMVPPDGSPAAGNATVLAGYTIQPIGPTRRASPSGSFDQANGTGYVYSGATVYQGEADISFRGTLSDRLLRTTGSAAGTLVETPIRSDAPVGSYSTDGMNATPNITVRQPQITGFRIENSRSVDVSGGLVRTAETDRIPVIAQSNFEDAEQLKLTVETPAGLDITDEVIDEPRVRQETDNGEPAAVHTTTDRAHEPRGSAATQIHGSMAKGKHGSTESAGLHATPIETQTQTETPVEASRTVTNTNLEQGGSTTVTITATVGSAGRIGISEEFSPAVRSAEIQSLIVNDESVVPLVAAADETGVAVAFQDLTPGDTVAVEYTLGVGDNDQTYEITGEVTSGSQEVTVEAATIVAGTGTSGTISAGDFVRWDVTLDSVEASALQITVAGSDDLKTDDARVQSTVSITDGEPYLSLESASAPRGTTNGITVQNGSGGATYTTAIPAADIRSLVEKDDYYQIFRNVGDTEQVGLVTDEKTYTDGTVPDEDVRAVYATVQIDPDDAAGATEIRTRFLADTADVVLSQEPHPTPTGFDTATLTVMDTSVSLREPQVYTTGAQTTIAGTATPGVDAVALYIRTERGFELIDLDGENDQRDAQIDVSGSSFSVDKVEISSGDLPGNDILSLPGQYQVGVVPVAAVQRTTSNESLPTRVAAPVFLNRNVNTTGLTVQNGSLSLTQTGQNQTIATTATDLSVTGQATGSEQILVALVGARGTIQTEIISTDGPTFTDTVSVEDVAAGEATLYAISTGRDGVVGDGRLPEADTNTEPTLTTLAAYLNQRVTDAMTPGQAAEVILSQTQADVGSDDRVVTEQIRVSQPRITITNVTTEGQTGQALRVRGSTNNRPSETSLLVTLRQNTETRQRTQVSSWAAGRWNVSLDTSNLSAGRYVVVADTINADNRQRIRINTTAQTTAVTTTQSARPLGADSASKTATVQPPTDTQSVPSTVPPLITHVHGFGFGILSYILSIILYLGGYRVLASAT